MPRKKDEALHASRVRQILDAARTCFVAHGFHGSSMRRILDTAGISSGGAYNYFSGKDDIVSALVESERPDIDRLVKRLTDCKDPLTGIARLVFDSIGYYSREDAVLAAEIYAESCRNPAIYKVMQANAERIGRPVRETIARGIESGKITDRYAAADLAEWVLALIDGYVGRIAICPGLEPKKAAQTAKKSVLEFLGCGS
ncbi:MAG: TetR/AcrR family transcriptional regulator [Proteobacteria bacterium]|nr:TetR/AcrR family transcriptional regulator [Pseudomonadota bacterium]